jgi:hypothetical protein
MKRDNKPISYAVIALPLLLFTLALGLAVAATLVNAATITH